MIKEMGRLKYSFVLPAYNIEKYIAACINSITQQGKQIEKIADFEVIVINDGSTDRTLEVAYECAAKDSHVAVLSQQNKGLSATRNAGIEKATGDYIIFVDGDDLIRNDTLEGLVTFCCKTNSDIIAFGANSYDGKKEAPFFSLDEIQFIDNGNPLDLLKKLLYADYSFGWCVWHYAFKRKFILERNLKFVEGKISEDIDYMLRAFLTAKSASCYFGEVVYDYRVTNSTSISRSAKFAFVEDLLYFVTTNLKLFDKIDDPEIVALLKLNYQTLLNVVLFWYSSYSREQQKKLVHALDKVTEIYQIPKQYRHLYKKKELLMSKMVYLVGYNAVGHLWGIKRRIHS